MRRFLALLLAAASCSAVTLAQAAEFKGKVTKPDGVTPLANVRTALYKHNTQTGYYDYFTAVYTNATGNYSLTTQQKGVYLVYFNVGSGSDNGFEYPFHPWYGYYYDNPLEIYYPETYNDVTPLTPTKAPTQFVVTDLAKVTTLALTKLNLIASNDCVVTGPITINGVPYSSFSAYSGGPSLPATGGTLNISFKVKNATTAAISTNLQALAFLTRRDASYANGDHSVQAFTRKAQSLPAKTTTTVNLAVSVPAALMAVSLPNSYGYWAFNMGVQMVTAQGVANCEDIMFPVQNVPTPVSAQLQALPDPAAQGRVEPDVIPLRLSETGQVIEWGPIPSTK